MKPAEFIDFMHIVEARLAFGTVLFRIDRNTGDVIVRWEPSREAKAEFRVPLDALIRHNGYRQAASQAAEHLRRDYVQFMKLRSQDNADSRRSTKRRRA